MFVLDTNVISEMMKPQPEPVVAQWIARQSLDLLFTTSISKAEVLAGIRIMPGGHRSRTLDEAARQVFEGPFAGRVLAFDEPASSAYADILAARRRGGRPIGTFDLFIAAIARAHDATVVTRDAGGFELAGIPIVNPWDPSPT